MRTSILGAAFLLVGAGAATLAAATTDPTGDGLTAINGSDTLLDVTNSILAACPIAFPAIATDINTDKYKGGGSGVGAGQMALGAQGISPMSKTLANTDYCTPPATATVYTTSPATASPSLTEALLVGLDGVAIVANEVTSCSTTSADQFGATSISVASTGVTPPFGLPACPGCVGSTYTFGDSTSGNAFAGQPSLDALAVLYTGFTHDKTFNCNSDVRKSLIKSWGNLFQNASCAGAGTCSAGLTHAWRRSDLSGTTDAFLGVLNLPNGTGTNGKSSGVKVGIGSLPALITAAVPGAGPKSVPFCNSFDANSTAATTPTSPGGSADFSDRDPIRTACGAGGGNDDVCEAYKNLGAVGNHLGDLGVVLPVLVPDNATAQAADDYPTAQCGGTCALIAPIKSNFVPDGFLCPGSGLPLNLGFCFTPTTDSTSNNAACVSQSGSSCFDVVGKPDGRQYNLPIIVPNSEVLQKYRVTTTPYNYAVDADGRPMQGSFFKIHSLQKAATNVSDPVAGTNGICQENDDTSQIGCLVDADPCSVGYAGREAAKGYPGTLVSGVITPSVQQNKGLAIDGVTPYTVSGTATCTPTSALALGTACVPGTNGTAGTTTDADFGIKSLLLTPGTTPLYPLSRRLYFATLFGFGNLQGGEKDLAQCYATDSVTGPIIKSHGFISMSETALGGVRCLDYPEESANTSTPLVNVQGSGHVAQPGCGTTLGFTAHDACVNSPLVDLNGTTVPESL